MNRDRPAYGIKPGKPPKPKRPWSSAKVSQPGAPKSSKIRKMSAGGGFGFGDDTKWMSTRAENAMNYNAANAPRVAGDGSSFGAGGPMTSSTPGMVAPQAEPTAAPGAWQAGGSIYNNTMSPIGVTSMRGQEQGTGGNKNLPTSSGQLPQPAMQPAAAPPMSIANQEQQTAQQTIVPRQQHNPLAFGIDAIDNSVSSTLRNWRQTPARREETYVMNNKGPGGYPYADGKAASIKDGQHMWGMVEGPGGPREDKVGPARLPGSEERALLSDGEAVIPADVVQSMNREFFSNDPDGVEKYSLINHQNPADKKDYQRRVENVGGPMALREFAGQYADGKKIRKCSGGKAILRLEGGVGLGDERTASPPGMNPLTPSVAPEGTIPPAAPLLDTVGEVLKPVAVQTTPGKEIAEAGQQLKTRQQQIDDAVNGSVGDSAQTGQLTTANTFTAKDAAKATGNSQIDGMHTGKASSQEKVNKALADWNAKAKAQKEAYDKYLSEHPVKNADGSPLRKCAGGKPVKKLADGASGGVNRIRPTDPRAAAALLNEVLPTQPATQTLGQRTAATAGMAGRTLGKIASTGAKLGGVYTVGDAMMDSDAPLADRVARGAGGALMMSKNPVYQLGGAALAAVPAVKDWALEEASKAFIPAWKNDLGLGGDRSAVPQPTPAAQPARKDAGMVIPNPSTIAGRPPLAAVPADGKIYQTGYNDFAGTGASETDAERAGRLGAEFDRRRVQDARNNQRGRGKDDKYWSSPQALIDAKTLSDYDQHRADLGAAYAQTQTEQLKMFREGQNRADQTRRDASAKTIGALEAAAGGDKKRLGATLQQYGNYEQALATVPAEARPTVLRALVNAQDSQTNDDLPVTPAYIQQALAMEDRIAANPGMSEASLLEAINRGGLGGLEDYIATIGSGKQVYDATTGNLYRQMPAETRAILRSQFPR